MSLFKQAAPEATRLKAYIYGESGTGKTITALSFPNPAVIDAEEGTVHYGKYKNFQLISTADPTTIKSAIDELLENPAIPGKDGKIYNVKTFVIDPFTAVYDTIMHMHENRMKVKHSNPAYVLQPMDFRYIKSEVKSLILKMLSLDMNIIVTARSAVDYAKEGFMQVVGTKPEGPGSLPYMFDVVLELSKTPDGKRMAKVVKDRTNTLPPTFEYNYESFVQYMGIEGLERDPVIINQKISHEQKTGRFVTTTFKGKEIKTAGITGDQITQLAQISVTVGEDVLKEKIRDDYNAEHILDLKQDEADLLIKDLEG